VVKTLAGKVTGKIEETKLYGISVQKFLNIYYAEAPVGKLRFMKPQPRKSWKGNTARYYY
jgi:carboxylesterase type B